jgi:ATP-dependent protease ClpP protease subunit
MTYHNSDLLQDVHNYGASLSSREIFLHNFCGTEEVNPGVEYRMANTFIKNITMLSKKSNDDITIHMHSIGGEWSDGMAIFDAINICKSKVSIIVYGQAESMSSIILQAAHERIMTANSYFMLHYGSTSNSGEYSNVHNWMKFEENICEKMFDIYAGRCYRSSFFKEKYGGKKESINKVKSWLKRKLKDGDWYMDAENSVYFGFADRIISR